MTAERRTGRPTRYNQIIANEICRQIAEGNSLRAITTQEDLPGLSTIMQWLSKESEFRQSFTEQYARAKQAQADMIADDILYIAEHEPDVNRARLMVDARKWYAGKLKPKKYGDIKQLDVSGGVDIRISPSSKPVGAGTSQIQHKTPAMIEDKAKGDDRR